MSQENTNNQDSQKEFQIAQEINSKTAAKVEKLKKSFKTTIIVGCAIACFVFIYMTVLYVNFADTVKPENLADAVAFEISERVPLVGRQMEQQLKDQAPAVVKSVSAFMVDESLPMLRKVLEEQIDEFSKDFINTAPTVLNDEVYGEMIRYNRANIQEAITSEGAMENPEFVTALEKKMIAEMEKGLKAESKDQVTQDMKQSLGALDAITSQLKQLSTKKNLTQEEQLTKQLISSWWTMLANEENSEKITDKDVKTVTDGLRETTEEIMEGAKEAIK